MKTRSSRFFVILLHLLGVSNHHLPSWYYDYLTSTTSSDRASFYSGIRGVHPHSIVLERLDLREVGGLDGVEWLGTPQGEPDSDSVSSINKPQEADESVDATTTQIARESFWLQDSQDGKCLGPSGGFSECGDATLWFILRRDTQRKSLRMGPFGVEEVAGRVDSEEPYRYALQIVDNDYLQQGPSSPSSATTTLSSLSLSWRQKRQQRRQRDCLVPSNSSRRGSQQESDASALELGSCAKQKTAWSWRVDSQGVLYLPNDVSQTRGRSCLRRTKASSAVLSSCQDSTEEPAQGHPEQPLVQFSLVRYHATSNPSLSSSHTTDIDQAKARPLRPSDSRNSERQAQETQEKKQDSTVSREGLPSNRDIAHSHASGPVMHSPIFEMNLAGRPLLSNIPSVEARKQSNQSPFAALKDSNPILFVGTGTQRSNDALKKSSSDLKNSLAGKAAAAPQMASAAPVKLRKIEMNPYIAQSQDEKWIDPQTGLEYHTDLCRYLGHDRKEYGRHTLVGVGQFLKTMLKIKVRERSLAR